jgi:hypothetical protein
LSKTDAVGGFALGGSATMTSSSAPLSVKLPSKAAQKRTTVGERKTTRIGTVAFALLSALMSH